MAQHHPHQAFAYSSSASSMHQSFDTCDSGELLGLQAGMEMLSLPANSLFPTQISCSQGLLSLSLSHPENLYHHQQQQQQQQQQHLGGFHQSYQLQNSVYLRPGQELLNEFCKLDVGSGSNSKQKQKERKDQEDHDAPSSSSSWNQSLLTMDVLELQKRKALLLSMLEEVDRRYKKYYEQMQRVVSSFEAVAGEGSAVVYSRLALRAMSKHFRGLRDGIVEQLKAMKKVMGEKEDTYTVSSGTTSKGATPRLRLLDQCLRQQKAQSGLLESQPWRPQRGLPERSVTILRAWLFDHFLHPYPSDVDKHILARQTGLSRSQVSNWFINARVRLWKPMVEEMYMKETEDQDNSNNNNESDNDIDNNNPHSNKNPNPNPYPNSSYDHQDQKPRLAAPDHHHLQIDGPDSNFGVVDLDFSPYNNNNNNNQGYGNGVSLSLGLQQSLFLSREHMEVLDGDLQAQNLPYRDLMGSHLLHDLA